MKSWGHHPSQRSQVWPSGSDLYSRVGDGAGLQTNNDRYSVQIRRLSPLAHPSRFLRPRALPSTLHRTSPRRPRGGLCRLVRGARLPRHRNPPPLPGRARDRLVEARGDGEPVPDDRLEVQRADVRAALARRQARRDRALDGLSVLAEAAARLDAEYTRYVRTLAGGPRS